jgi:hypothetical protein
MQMQNANAMGKKCNAMSFDKKCECKCNARKFLHYHPWCRDKETSRFHLQFCHRLSVENGGFIWAFGLSKLTARSKPIAAFDDAANEHCAPYLPVLHVSALVPLDRS